MTDPNADADHDGFTNFQEFLAGTNPRDEDDRPRLQSLGINQTPAGRAAVLGFSARSNKTYSIAYRNTAGGSGWTNLVRFSSVPTNRTVTVTNLPGPSAPSRFYRLVTPRLP